MNTNTLRSVLVYTHPATLAAAMAGLVVLPIVAILVVMLAMLVLALLLADLVGKALWDETRAIWRTLTIFPKREQGSTPPVATDRPDPIVVEEPPLAIAIPWGIPMEEPTPDVVEMVPDAHVVNPTALDGLADAMKGEPTPTLQAAEMTVAPKVKRSRAQKVKVKVSIRPKWEDMTTDELVAQCKAKGVKANARWKRETLLAKLKD